MSNHIMTKLGATSLSLGVLFALGGCKAVQPKPQCKAQPADYAAKYEPQGQPPMGCDVLKGEVLHFQYYQPKPGTTGLPSVAIEPASVSDAVQAGEDAKVDVMADEDAASANAYFSLGKYTDVNPDDNDICSAPKLNDTHVTVAMIPADPTMMGSMPTDAVDLTYQWSNLKMLVRPDSNGVYFTANLVRKAGDCSVTYKVTGVQGAPVDGSASVAYCGDMQVPVLDAMGNPVKDDMGNAMTMLDPTMGKPDQSRCDSKTQGTGLPRNLSFTCDADTLLCLVNQAFPKLIDQ